MNRTNINITYQHNLFTYLLEYIPNSQNMDIGAKKYIIAPRFHRVDIVDNDDKIYCENDWYDKDSWKAYMNTPDTNYDYIDTYLPSTYDTSTVRFNFPDYAPEVYEGNITYALNINTWINGVPVHLGTKIFRRFDSLANEKMKMFNGYKYHESIDIQIIDPFDIEYGDRWRDFRRRVCGEKVMQDGSQLNNTGAQLGFSLYLVEEDGEGGWIKKSNHVGSQNSINISPNIENYLSLDQFIEFDPNKGPIIRQKINFNKVYGNNLKQYLKETYCIDVSKLRYSLVVKDDNNVYIGLNENGVSNINMECFQTTIDFSKNHINFDGWNDWNDWESNWNTMVYFASSVSFLDSNNNELLYIVSNEIPITKEIYKYFIKDSEGLPNRYIDLNEIDMEVKNFNVVNKVINQIVHLDRPDDSKSNIIQPVFFRVRDAQDLIIHPAVTENICINLDAYKSKVEIFNIQIGECLFKQIGSNGYGIIFKIVGRELPTDVTSGTYYILNENSELVTTGKYIYE